MTLRGAAVALALGVAGVGCMPGPDPAVVARQKGDELMGKNDFAGAAAEYQRSLELKPNQENTWEKLAMAQLRQDQRDLAAATLRRKAEREADPAKKAEALRNAAGLYLQSTSDHALAEPFLLDVLKIEPKDDGSITWLAEIYAQRGGARSNQADAQPEALDVALRYYDQLATLKPDATAPLAHKRIVLTKYLGFLDQRRAAAEQTLPRKTGPELEETKDRIEKLRAKKAELLPVLDATNARLAELKKPKAN